MATEEDEIFWKKRNGNITDGSDDTWDDTELIKAYDKAFAELKEESNRSVHSNNEQTEDKTKKRKKKKKKSKNANKKWKVGGKCLAIYSGDSLYYEATILSANYEENIVEVKFSYYGNEEEVDMRQLLPVERKSEMEVVPNSANYFNGIEQESSEDTNTTENEKYTIHGWRVSDICYVSNKKGAYQQAVINSFTFSDHCQVTIIKSNRKREVKVSQLHSSLPSEHKKSHLNSRPSQYHSSDIPWHHTDLPTYIPPPPPMLLTNSRFPNSSYTSKFFPPHNGHPDHSYNNFSSSNIPQCPPLPDMPEDVISGDEEALANMLMSWYISGFHTGYYQGVQRNTHINNHEHRDEKKKNKKRWDKTLV